MFVVRRTSPTGGSSQYLVSTGTNSYAWRKVAKKSARLFTTKAGASRVANTNEGIVTSL